MQLTRSCRISSRLDQGHEILIINDGSNDDSHQILSKCKFISLIHLKENFGKGIAIRNGIEKALNEKLILLDFGLDLSKTLFLIKFVNF